MFVFINDLLHFISSETGENSIFCFNPVCKHEPASSTNTDPECMAAGYYHRTSTAYHEGYIYMFVRDVFEHKIYKMNINSGNRELVAEFPFSCLISRVVFNGDHVYYTARMNTVIEDGSGVVDGFTELVEVDIRDGSYRLLTTCGQDMNGSFWRFDVCGNTLFYVLQTEDSERTVYSMSLDTLETNTEVSPEEFISEKHYCGIYDDESFFYYTGEGNISIYNIVTGKSREVLSVNLGNDKLIIEVIAGAEKVYYRLYDAVAEVYEYYLYDMTWEQLYDLSEKCNSAGYEIVEYNPYASMFQYMVYDENNGALSAPVSEAELCR